LIFVIVFASHDFEVISK